MPNNLVFEGEGPWGLSDLRSGVAEVLGESALLSFNFSQNGYDHHQLHLIFGSRAVANAHRKPANSDLPN